MTCAAFLSANFPGQVSQLIQKCTVVKQKLCEPPAVTSTTCLPTSPIPTAPLLSGLSLSSFTWSDVHATIQHCRKPATEAWCAANNNNPSSYVQVDLGDLHRIDSVSTWGYSNSWVTSYDLEYSIDGITFVSNCVTNPFIGNHMSRNEKKNLLIPNIAARYLRFTPRTFNLWKTMRIEATGRRI